MNQKVLDNCQLLVKNRDIISDTFTWGRKPMMLAGAAYYVGMKVTADGAKLKECERIMKDNTHLLSDFREHAKMPVLCKMAASDNPEEYFHNLQAILGYFKALKWNDGSYKILASIIINDRVGPEKFEEVTARTIEIYHSMKDTHPMLTSGEDIPYCALLAISGYEQNKALDDMEECYDILSSAFSNKNAVQSICQILSVHDAKATEKCGRVADIYRLLKDKKHKFGGGFELAVLGTLATLDVPKEELVEEIINADEYLRDQKGFGPMGTGEKIRRMYAALMVMDAYSPDDDGTTDCLVSSLMSMVIAIEICMIVLITSAAASSAAR